MPFRKTAPYRSIKLQPWHWHSNLSQCYYFPPLAIRLITRLFALLRFILISLVCPWFVHWAKMIIGLFKIWLLKTHVYACSIWCTEIAYNTYRCILRYSLSRWWISTSLYYVNKTLFDKHDSYKCIKYLYRNVIIY